MDPVALPVACFAPALSDETIESYRRLVADSLDRLSPEQQAALSRCLDCVSAWWALPESTLQPKQNLDVSVLGFSKPVGIVPLPDNQITSLWSVTPFPQECNYLSSVLDSLPHGTRSLGLQPVTGSDGLVRMIEQTEVVDASAKALRDAAFHLLWYTHEIARDREPLSQDKLVK